MARPRRSSLAALFALIALGFAGLAVWSGTAGQWIVLAASGVLALWMADLALRALR